MTRVDFHVGADDVLVYTARLVRKAVASGASLVVTAEQSLLEQFDVRLWTFAQLDFVPHVFAGSTLELQTPVILATDPQAPSKHEVLVNLGSDIPEGFARYERLIEIIGASDAARAAGRARYKHYRDRGYALTMHEVTAATA
jgi:DNA polymerase III subunit chi